MYFASGQTECAELGTSGANGDHFRMGGRIVRSGYLVSPFANDTAIVYYDGTKRAAANVGDVLFGEGNRLPHEIIAIHGRLELLALSRLFPLNVQLRFFEPDSLFSVAGRYHVGRYDI